MAVGLDGAVVGRGAAPLASLPAAGPGFHEQDTASWWPAVCAAVRGVLDELRAGGHDPAALAAAAVDGTSGTLAPLDAGGRPVRPALMYNDARSGAEATAIDRRFR